MGVAPIAPVVAKAKTVVAVASSNCGCKQQKLWHQQEAVLAIMIAVAVVVGGVRVGSKNAIVSCV